MGTFGYFWQIHNENQEQKTHGKDLQFHQKTIKADLEQKTVKLLKRLSKHEARSFASGE